MEGISQEIVEIINLANKNDMSYKTKIPSVMNKLTNMEKQTEQSQVINILLNFINEEFNAQGLPCDKLSKVFKPKIEGLVEKINSSKHFMPNALEEFIQLKNTKDKIIENLVEIAIKVYKKKQVEFISKFYKTINLSNLKMMLGDIDAKNIINERAWKVENNFVIINNAKDPGDFDSAKAINDLQFLASTNISLNTLISQHGKLIEFEGKAK